jgi:TRAP-type C4-dicarboxylate transport system permease small subunit
MELQKLDNVLKQVEIVQVHCSWVITVLVTLMIVLDIALRFLFNKPLPASWEISEILMPYIVILAFAYTLSIDKHIRVSMITNFFPAKIQVGLRVFTNLLCFLMCSFITYFSCFWFWKSFSIREQILAAIPLPWWFGKFVVPIAFGTMGIRYLMLAIFDLVRTPSDQDIRR